MAGNQTPRRLSIVLTVLVLVALMITSFSATPSRAQGNPNDDLPVKMVLVGTVQSITPDQLVLNDGTTISLSEHVKLPANLATGDTITLVVQINDDTLVLMKIEAGSDLNIDPGDNKDHGNGNDNGNGNGNHDNATAEASAAATESGHGNGNGNSGDHGKGKGQATPEASATATSEATDTGKGNGNGNGGNGGNGGHGKGKGGADQANQATPTTEASDTGKGNGNGNGGNGGNGGHGKGKGGNNSTPEVTTTATAEASAAATESGHGNGNGNNGDHGKGKGQPTAEATDQPGCGSNSDVIQPVANRIAEGMNVGYSEIMDWHCQGYGFGEIVRAYLLAQASGKNGGTAFSVAEVFAMRHANVSWGEIMKNAGVSPSDFAPGLVIKSAGNGLGQ